MDAYQRTTRVSVLPDHPTVARCRGDFQFLRQEEAESSRVQIGATSDHLILWKTGKFPRNVGENVDRIRDDKKDRVRAVFHQLGNNLFEDIRISLNKIEPRLAFLLTSAGGHYAHARIRRYGIIRARVDFRVPQERTTVL